MIKKITRFAFAMSILTFIFLTIEFFCIPYCHLIVGFFTLFS